ncbi:AAA family ATPase [Nocardia sp. BMG111209]|uniref:bifunctional aminoglycoside phosphotransferase/ATP-binding protein n=1 Tax=Nocardia sp. BMG111209 TaxID=1160137 RepID=UPI000381E39D|nr:AAA family ATPase [Nocardia sp. BMG111209]
MSGTAAAQGVYTSRSGPDGEPYAVLHETHTGLVVLCGDRAYKVKKPIVTDFLDFGTRALRAEALERELRLNRRLAPDVYLGIGCFHPPGGEPDEPALVMRRLPQRARLSTVIEDPVRAAELLPALVETLIGFHDTARRDADVAAAGTADALRTRWKSLLDGLIEPPVPAGTTARLTRLMESYVAGRVPLFEARIADGRVVDGHGDLHAGDIYLLPDGFRIIDCLDFDDRLRCVDRLDDIAFLAMDLEFLGHPELAAELGDRYRAHTADPAPPSLWHHYLAYRATVRAKVDGMRHEQGDPRAADRAARHTEIALRHLAAGTVRLALVGGLPGTGKSTVARALAEATGAVVIASDRVRARMRETGAVTGAAGSYGRGAYTRDARDRVYGELLAQARDHLGHGRSVVLDAGWQAAAHRRAATALAAETSAEMVELLCRAPQSTAAARIEARRHSESDATAAIAAAMAAEAEPWPEALPLDTTAALPDTTAAALRAWYAPDR